jgi:hypothetical protein
MTARKKRQNDMILRRDFLDTRADRHDDPGALVAEYDRLRHRIDLISRHHIGMAHPGRNDAHQDLVRA